QRFHLTSTGAITNDSVAWGPTNFCVSNNQFRAISGGGLCSTNNNTYDVQITDFVYQRGRANGGLHAGEPLDYPGPTGTNGLSSPGPHTGNTMYENTTWSYQEFQTGSAAVRPTYNTDGIAVDVTFRMRHVNPPAPP